MVELVETQAPVVELVETQAPVDELDETQAPVVELDETLSLNTFSGWSAPMRGRFVRWIARSQYVVSTAQDGREPRYQTTRQPNGKIRFHRRA